MMFLTFNVEAKKFSFKTFEVDQIWLIESNFLNDNAAKSNDFLYLEL